MSDRRRAPQPARLAYAHRLRTCLASDVRAEEQAAFYVALLPGSRVEQVVRRPDGGVVAAEFALLGAPFLTLNMGMAVEHGTGASISVLTGDQAETDRLWDALLDGGRAMRCGWLTDRFGVAWQVVPEALPRLLCAPDAAAAGRATRAMMTMGKIDIAALEAAFHAEHEEAEA